MPSTIEGEGDLPERLMAVNLQGFLKAFQLELKDLFEYRIRRLLQCSTGIVDPRPGAQKSPCPKLAAAGCAEYGQRQHHAARGQRR